MKPPGIRRLENVALKRTSCDISGDEREKGKKAEMSARLMTVRELSEALHLHPQTVYLWKQTRRLPFIMLDGRLRFDRNEVERFIEDRKTSILTPPPPPKLDLNLAEYDKLRLRRCFKAVGKKPRRWSYNIGSVSLRKTKKGHDRWYIDYRSRQGKRIREVVKAARTRGEAVRVLHEKITEEFNGAFDPGSGKKFEYLSFDEFADKYLAEYAEREKRRADTDRFRLRSAREFFGSLKLRKITKSMILEYRQARLKAGISKITTNRELALFRGMFNWAMREGIFDSNPTQGIKKFSEIDSIRSRVLSEAEEERLISELAPHLRPIILTALHTGLRYREILNLPWKNVDLEKRLLKIENTKSGKARIIPINSLLLEVLSELSARKSGSRVFPFRDIRRGFENACRRAKIDDLTFHDLRRTFGTRLLSRGVNIKTISLLYGHSSVVVTERYLHPSDELSDEVVEMLAVRSNLGQTERPENLRLPANSLISVN